MNRTLSSALLVATTAVVVTAAGPATPAVSGTQPDRLTFMVEFRPFEQNFVDLGSPGPGIGDQLVFQDVLKNAKGRQVGIQGGTCVITAPLPDGFQTHCVGTVSLADGQISYQGLVSNAPTKQLAVVGGTGRYGNVSGEATLVELGGDKGTLTLTIDRH
jgi:hypothetical protein